MKYFKIFIIGFLSILIIQFCILVFLETVYFSDNTSYSSVKIENNTVNEAPKPKLILENGSTNTSASFDGKYLSYLKDNNLFFQNLETGEITKIMASDGMTISYYKWIYDRDRLILAERPINLINGNNFQLYYYDINSKSKMEIFNVVNNKAIKIPIINGNEKIDTIEMSTLNNVMYVKLSNPNNYCRIYRINIMAQENSIKTVTSNIGSIISTKREDILLYENLNNNKVYKYGSSLPIVIEGNKNLKLLGVDNNDNVYLAVSINNQTQKIYYGNLSSQNWKKVDIKTLTYINNIFINIKGIIFIHDKSIITELPSGMETYIDGNIIGKYDDGIIFEKNNVIDKKSTPS